MSIKICPLLSDASNTIKCREKDCAWWIARTIGAGCENTTTIKDCAMRFIACNTNIVTDMYPKIIPYIH